MIKKTKEFFWAIRPFLKKIDFLRWVLSGAICWFVFQETGVATFTVAILFFLESELETIKNRIMRARDKELIKSINILNDIKKMLKADAKSLSEVLRENEADGRRYH